MSGLVIDLPCEAVPALASLSEIDAARDQLVNRHERISAKQLAELAAVPDALVPSLAALAHETRLAWCGETVEVEGILSAKTGGCPEDCHFCAQSSRFDTPVLATPFLDTEQVLEAARQTAAAGRLGVLHRAGPARS